jgi:general secretion pathway protein H
VNEQGQGSGGKGQGLTASLPAVDSCRSLPLVPCPLPLFSSGFTLLELLVVLAVMAMAAAIVVPRLPTSEATALKRSARGVAALLRSIDNEATTRKTTYRLTFDLGLEQLRVKELQGGEEAAPNDVRLARPVLAEGIAIEDVRLPRLGTVTSGQVQVEIGPGGLSEYLTVHLVSPAGKQFTVMAFPQTGKVTVNEGYLEKAL